MPLDADAALDFLGFVTERHRVWEARQAGLPQPWTTDPIVASRKFTNVFRVLDPGSQFVLTDLIHEDPVQTLTRVFLYRHTNLPSAWRACAAEFGSMPLLEELGEVLEFWRETEDRGEKLFSGAYMIYPQSAERGTRKIESVVALTQRVIPQIASEFIHGDMKRQFALLRQNKGVADFMSMQILTDFGYSLPFRENLFVVPGPGARKGAAELGLKPDEAVEWAYEAVRSIPDGPRLEGRLPSMMDVQNCLCEFSKYARFSRSSSAHRPYSPAHPGVQSPPVLPQHWN